MDRVCVCIHKYHHLFAGTFDEQHQSKQWILVDIWVYVCVSVPKRLLFIGLILCKIQIYFETDLPEAIKLDITYRS